MRQFITAICAALVAGCSFGVTFAPKEYVDRMDATNRDLVVEYVNTEVAKLVRKNNRDYILATNRAMTALQSHQSLWPAVEAATNYADTIAAEFENGTRTVQNANNAGNASDAQFAYMLSGDEWYDQYNASDLIRASTNAAKAVVGAFAATGTVFRAHTYGTLTRWTDATGCVWEVGAPEWRSTTEGVVFNEWNEITYGDYAGMWDLYFSVYGDASHVYTNAPSLHQSITVPAGEWWYHDEMETDRGAFPVSFALVASTNLVGRVALTNDIPDTSGFATQQQTTNAAVAVVDAKISTNNEAFVSAVLAAPLAGADAGDLAELSEYGSYGTVGAAILALIAGLAALKRRMGTADVAIAMKANTADLPYALVTPGEWEFALNGELTNFSVNELVYEEDSYGERWVLRYYSDETGSEEIYSNEPQNALVLDFDGIIATRPSLPGHLLDRAVNAVPVSGDTTLTLTLPALVNAGKARDFLVRLDLTALATAPEVKFVAPTGEVTFETDDGAMPELEAGKVNLVSFTETAVGVIDVAHKVMQEVE